MIAYKFLKCVRLVLPILLLMLGYYLFVLIKSKATKDPITISQWIMQIQADLRSLAGNFTIPMTIFIILASLITNPAIHQIVGVHNLELKPEGTYCFYVEATNEKGKTYVLPAEIDVVIEYADQVSKEYYVKTVYFSNGGYLDTYDMDSLDIGDHSWHETYNGEEWKIKLLNKHAYSPAVNETNNAKLADIVWLAVEISLPFFFLFAFCYKERDKRRIKGMF